jgi:hypothetical protein
VQCKNRDCEYYGKLVCCDCDPAHDQQEPPSLYMEPIDGYWPLWLVVTLVASVALGNYTTIIAGVLTFLGLYFGLGYILQLVGYNIFGKERQVELRRISKVHTCLQCNQPAKVVPLHDRR